jgi:hypothetical protein
MIVQPAAREQPWNLGALALVAEGCNLSHCKCREISDSQIRSDAYDPLLGVRKFAFHGCADARAVRVSFAHTHCSDTHAQVKVSQEIALDLQVGIQSSDICSAAELTARVSKKE